MSNPVHNAALPATQTEGPAPPLINPTGDVKIDVMADVINKAASPFQNLSQEKTDLGRANAVVGGIMAVINSPLDLLNKGFALATEDIAKLFPPLPAATLGMLHIGIPHTHMHPPSFIPPAPPIPLPSLGPVMLSGCISVLINGVPAARAGDLGFSLLCGTFTPPFEVFTGSSKIFIGGGRAARMLDITRHCQPGAAAGKAASMLEKVITRGGVALGVAGLAAGSLNAADKGSEGDSRGAALAAAQVAADAAALALSLLMGLDPGIPPCFGALVAGHPNVLVGGFPMPPWLDIAMGLGKLGKGLRGKPPPAKSQNNKCDRPGHPIDPVTGASVDEFVDYAEPGPLAFLWGRSYSSASADREGPLGRGFRHTYERSLAIDLDRVLYTDAEGRQVGFPIVTPGVGEVYREGYALRARASGDAVVYEVARTGEPTIEFTRRGGRDVAPRMTRLWVPGAHADITYDERGRLASMIEIYPTGSIETRFELDDHDHIIEVRRGPRDGSALPLIAAYAYDRAGCLVSFQDALGARASYAYDAAGRMTRMTDRNGYSFHFAYDDQGRCVEEHGDDGLWRVALRYEPERRRTIVTEADGGAWIYAYNENGTLVSIRDPYAGELTRILDDDGKVVREVGPDGATSLRLLYDGAGRNIEVLDRFGKASPPLDDMPDPPGPLEHHAPETARAQQWGALDARTPVTEFAMALPTEVQATAPDAQPDPHEGRAPLLRQDALGRVIDQVDAAGHRRSWAYDPNGNVVRYRDAEGREHGSFIRSWNLIGAEEDPLGHRTAYAYTAHAQVERVIDPGGGESRYEYDLKDRLVRVLRHGVVREEYAYDRADRLVEKRDGAGNLLLRLSIGPRGLPSARHLGSGEVHRYAYDGRGHITRASADKVEVMREFDSWGRLIADERDGRGVRHEFKGEDLRATSYFGRFTVTYRRGHDGAWVIEGPAGGAHRIRRDERGRVMTSLGNGTDVLSSYDEAGRCLGRVAFRTRNGEVTAWSLRCTYSAEGELRRTEDSARGVTTYTYDAAHRLIAELGPGGAERTFLLDGAGNVIEKPGLARADLLEGNRLRAAGAERFRYDARNHLTEHGNGERAMIRYHYNSLDMLVGAAWSGHDEAWSAAYDGLGRRLYKSFRGERAEFFWDGDRLAAEVSPTGALRIYVYPGPEALVPLLFIEYDSLDAAPESGRPHYPIGNALGVPLQIEDQAGAIVWWASHVAPYGEVTVRPGARVAYALRFPGHYFDEETGLHYNRFRYYSPRLGRYLQSDPAGQSGGVNLYAYPANPLVDVDVLGLTFSCIRRGKKNRQNTEAGPNNEIPLQPQPNQGPHGWSLDSHNAQQQNDPGPVTPLADYPGFAIQYNSTQRPFFEHIVNDNLRQIAETPTGRALLDSIANSTPGNQHPGQPPDIKVIIRPTHQHEMLQDGMRRGFGGQYHFFPEQMGNMRPFNPTHMSGSTHFALDQDMATDGRGSVATVTFNNTILNTSTGESTTPHTVLAHELIHADHAVHGVKRDGRDEELATVGLPPFEHLPLTENNIRTDLGIPVRETYGH